MAKALRKAAWDRYLRARTKGAKTKGTPLVAWGWISVDLDRLDTALFKSLPGGELAQMGSLDVSDLKILEKKLHRKRTNEIEIYATDIAGKILKCYWIINPGFVGKKGQGNVDFEGACARVITSELEALYSSYGEDVESIRKRDPSGGLPYEHGTQGTGDALNQAGGNAAEANKKLQGLKSQKEVLNSLSQALKGLPVDTYTGYLESAIFDWADANFRLTHEMRKNRSIQKIDDLWQGAGSITLGNSVIGPKSIPKNSKKVDAVIRKAFKQWTESPEFLKSVLRYVKHLPIKQRLAAFSASKSPDQALFDYTVGNIAFVFTKTGKIDKRYKINKTLLKKARKDMASNTAVSKLKGKSKTKERKATGGKKGNRAEKHANSTFNPLALREMINAVLPDEILQNMGSPALNNRTGRFRNSAQVTNALIGPRGGVQIDYTYQRNPYETFEPGGAMGSTQRDPRRLIGNSIREVAQEIMGKKFIKTRRV